MRVCYFSCSNIFGGVENIILQTLNELCKSYEVALILPKGANFLNKFDKRVKIYEYKSYDKRYNIFLYFEIIKFLHEFKPDILHTHGAKATQMGFILSKFLKFKFIATKHNNRKGKIFNKIQNVIAVSKNVANTINHESKVIYFGINKQNIKPNLSKTFTITAIGRLDKIKGFDILINEVKKLKFNFILQIVGDGFERENLQNLINKLNLKNKVKLFGFCQNIPQILANSNLQVISSIKEGFPLTLLEGLFYAPIVISTPVGGIVEILDDEFLINHENLSDKIDEIYMNYDAKVEIFKEKNKNIIENFKFEKYILNLQNYYEEIYEKS